MKSEFKIEKGVPMPSIGGKARYCKYPFRKMEVGDSFAISCADPDKQRADCQLMRQTASQFQGRNPEYKFSTRQVLLENNKREVRIWRIEADKKEGAK